MRAVIVEDKGDGPTDQPRKAVLLGKETSEGFVVSTAVVGSTQVDVTKMRDMGDENSRTLVFTPGSKNIKFGSDDNKDLMNDIMNDAKTREAAGKSAPAVGGRPGSDRRRLPGTGVDV